jgi:NADPH:quinone reductase-like Zn-dependent oxidoreductase
MQAIVQDRYGPPEEVLRLAEAPAPTAGVGEVLVRVGAASLHPDIWHVVTGKPYLLRLMGAGLLRPRRRIPGIDMAGVVEALGPGVERFQVGDAVFGEVVRRHQWEHGGCFAELVAAPAARLERMPSTLDFAQAAACPTSGTIAVQAVRDEARVRAGQRVLVNGAGGGVGSFAVQVAKAWGAEVTAVDLPDKCDLLRRLGADHVLDASREDFTARGQRYDAIVDIPGNHPWAKVQRALVPSGRYVLVGHDAYGASAGPWLGSVGRFLGLAARAPFDARLPGFAAASGGTDRFAVLVGLLEQGKVVPALDRAFPLREAVAALRYLAQGQAKGKVVLTAP